MRFDFVTQPATFVDRPNRYRVVAQLHATGETIHAHCPDPGRLTELLIPGVTVHVSPLRLPVATRKTSWDLRFVEQPVDGQLVSLDTRLPNQLFAEGLRTKWFTPFDGYTKYTSEVSLPPVAGMIRSRFDFQLADAAGNLCWVEVKSASLVIDRCARFPDAPTERGRRHVAELIHLVQQGTNRQGNQAVRAAIVFIIQRPDADCLTANRTTDPAFADALVTAHAAGVAIYAYTCDLSTSAITLARSVPVIL